MKNLRIPDTNDASDSIDFTVFPGGSLSIEIDNPWAGSSDTGFGATLNISLSKEQAASVRDFLNQNYPA